MPDGSVGCNVALKPVECFVALLDQADLKHKVIRILATLHCSVRQRQFAAPACRNGDASADNGLVEAKDEPARLVEVVCVRQDASLLAMTLPPGAMLWQECAAHRFRDV